MRHDVIQKNNICHHLLVTEKAQQIFNESQINSLINLASEKGFLALVRVHESCSDAAVALSCADVDLFLVEMDCLYDGSIFAIKHVGFALAWSSKIKQNSSVQSV